VLLRQGRVALDVRVLGAGNIASGFGRRSLEGHPAPRLPRRRVCCRASVSDGSARVAGCHRSLSRRCRGVICPSPSGRRSRSCSRVVVGVREIARALGRAPSTVSRELQRNAAIRTGRPEYRASTAQTHADRRARAGLRISEALALAESDVDSDRGAILVRHGKGGKRREVGPTRGRPWSAAGVRVQMHHAATQAGVRRRVAPHQLRHAHAVGMSREGVPLLVIQRQLGIPISGLPPCICAGSTTPRSSTPSMSVQRR
jgi:Helix-turn-helix domain/Phage integrase family